ncbi:hypothetical protein BDZ94DRAFT_1318806 [Collybia nuda]|uniref:4a-hydroxytetrahydrobiopterin dehydratase n=1 Tax=Collybia nuda TaxID=64659 RepID=A0A9P6CNW7_9AGAR|nr:hypothetical protein BDZ94DRAFT_1318806 [Collybia nuda]
MHSRAVLASRTILPRTNCRNLISAFATVSKRTRPQFLLSKLPYHPSMERVRVSLRDTRPLSTATTLEVERQLSEDSHMNPSNQTENAIGITATPLELDIGLPNSKPEQQSTSVSLSETDPPDNGSTDAPVVSQNLTQPPEIISEASDTDRYYGPVDLSFKSIPALPPPVSGWPTPWAEKADIEEYLLPLYGRGWGISFKLNRLKVHTNASKDDQPKAKILGPPRSTAYLVVEYEFDDYQTAADFVTGVATISTAENHHPRTMSIMNAVNPTVSLTVHTDSAKRPMWDQPLGRKIAGITLRDLRFAILVETLYSNSFGQGREHKRLIRPLEHRPQWQKFLRILRKNSLDKPPAPSPPRSPTPSSKSKSLKSQHTPQGEVSTEESATKPVCATCGMNHLSENCPLNRPYSICPNCGGDHWVAHCPQPRANKAPIT